MREIVARWLVIPQRSLVIQDTFYPVNPAYHTGKNAVDGTLPQDNKVRLLLFQNLRQLEYGREAALILKSLRVSGKPLLSAADFLVNGVDQKKQAGIAQDDRRAVIMISVLPLYWQIKHT